MYNFLLLKMYICRYLMYNSFSSIKMQRNKWISRKFVLWWATIFFWVHIFSTRNIFGTYKQKQGELSTFCHSFVKQASSHTGWFWEKKDFITKGPSFKFSMENAILVMLVHENNSEFKNTFSYRSETIFFYLIPQHLQSIMQNYIVWLPMMIVVNKVRVGELVSGKNVKSMKTTTGQYLWKSIFPMPENALYPG